MDGLSKNIFSKEVMSARDHPSMYCGLIFPFSEAWTGEPGELQSMGFKRVRHN